MNPSLTMQKARLLVTVEDLDIARRVASAAEKSVYRRNSLRCHDTLYQLDHLGRYPEPWHEDRDARRIRHDELGGNTADGRIKRHELTVAERRVTRQYHRLPLDRAGNRFVVVAAGRRTLNVFAYTGGFSVAALAGGAASVLNIDQKSLDSFRSLGGS